MPRYFFDTDDGDVYRPDVDGKDLADPGAARRAALETLPDLVNEKMPDGDQRSFAVTVKDDRGKPVYVATLSLRGRWMSDHSA